MSLKGPHQRRHEGRHARQGNRPPVGPAPAARRHQAKEVDERIELDDGAVLAVVDKMLKQRRDSVAQYEAPSASTWPAPSAFEIDVVSAYKPAGPQADEIAAEVDAAIAVTGASQPADMGKLMAVLKPQLAGKADMADVSNW